MTTLYNPPIQVKCTDADGVAGLTEGKIYLATRTHGNLTTVTNDDGLPVAYLTRRFVIFSKTVEAFPEAYGLMALQEREKGQALVEIGVILLFLLIIIGCASVFFFGCRQGWITHC